MEYIYSKHSLEMIEERNIEISWVEDTLNIPDLILETEYENEIHYIKKIESYGNRYLRVVLNPKVSPKNIITIFFDRRIKEL